MRGDGECKNGRRLRRFIGAEPEATVVESKSRALARDQLLDRERPAARIQDEDAREVGPEEVIAVAEDVVGPRVGVGEGLIERRGVEAEQVFATTARHRLTVFADAVGSAVRGLQELELERKVGAFTSG